MIKLRIVVKFSASLPGRFGELCVVFVKTNQCSMTKNVVLDKEP